MLEWILGKEKKKYHTTCVPESILSAWTWAQHGHKVRIAVQHIDEHTDHAQAQALVDDVWTPLTPLWDAQVSRISIQQYDQHFPVEPYRYLSLQDWINEQVQYASGLAL